MCWVDGAMPGPGEGMGEASTHTHSNLTGYRVSTLERQAYRDLVEHASPLCPWFIPPLCLPSDQCLPLCPVMCIVLCCDMLGVFSWRELVGEDAGKGALFLSVSFEGKALMAARVQPMDVLQFPFLAQFLPDNVLGGAEGRKAWARAKNQVGTQTHSRSCSPGERQGGMCVCVLNVVVVCWSVTGFGSACSGV